MTRLALLVIDMQAGFLSPASPLHVPLAAATVPAVARAAQATRSHGGQVVWVMRRYREDGLDVEPSRRERWLRGKPLSPAATPEMDDSLAPGLKVHPEDWQIVKPSWSAFFATSLDLWLRRRGIADLVLAGTSTPNCVRSTAFDADALGYRVHILADATSSATPAVQAANLQDLAAVGFRVLTTEEYVRMLEEREEVKP